MAASQRGEDAGHVWTYIMLRETASSFSFQSSWSSSQLTCSPTHLVGRIHLNDRRASYKHRCDWVTGSFCVQLLQSIVVLNDEKQWYFLTLLPSLRAGLVSLGFFYAHFSNLSIKTSAACKHSWSVHPFSPHRLQPPKQKVTERTVADYTSVTVIFEIVISARRRHCIYLIYREKRSCKHIIINQISDLKTH